MKKFTIVGLGLLGLALIAGCSPRDAAPPSHIESSRGEAFEATDLAGRKVELRRPIRRIVLMRGFFVHELAMLLGDEIEEKLVGWDSSLSVSDRQSYDKFVGRYPKLADVAVLGDVLRGTVSAEAVLALKPDLVIMDVFMAERDAKFVDSLERAGLPMLFLEMLRDPLRSPQESLRLLGRALGKGERAEAIATFIDAEVAKVTAGLEKLSGPEPSLYMESSGGVGVYGNTYGLLGQRHLSGYGSLMSQLRCRNIAADVVPSMGKISPEFLLKADPDVIVMTGAHWVEIPDSLHLGYFSGPEESREQLRAFTTRPGWDGLKAVKGGRLYGLYMRLCGHATGFVAAQQLAKWLHPDAFRDLDPDRAHREFYERFMPVSRSGIWSIDLGRN